MYKSALVCTTLVVLWAMAWMGGALASTRYEQARTTAYSLAGQTGWEQSQAATTRSRLSVAQARTAQALTAPEQTAQTAQTAPAHPLAIQTLSVEKPENKHQSATIEMQVFQFNYDLQQARRLIFDTLNETLISSSSINSVHLPLNDTEISFAITLAEAQSELVQQVRDEQLRRGHIQFEKLSDLNVKASIFEPLDEAHECHVQRCALLSLFDDSRTVFTVEPVINLQQMSVSVLKGL